MHQSDRSEYQSDRSAYRSNQSDRLAYHRSFLSCLALSRTWLLFSHIIWNMFNIRDNFINRTSRCLFNGRLFFTLCQIWIFIQSSIFFDTIDLLDHLVFCFLHRPIFAIKTVIIGRWWFTNCQLPISNIIWTQICRKRRHIWNMKPWCTRIRQTEISTPWYIHGRSIWRKRHWHRSIIPLPILIKEFLFWNRSWLLEIFSPTSMFDILLFWGFSRKLLIWLRLFLFMLMTAFGFKSFSNTNLEFFWV